MLSSEEKARWVQEVMKADVVSAARNVASALKSKPFSVDDLKPHLEFLEKRLKELNDQNTMMISTLDTEELTVLEVAETEKFEHTVSLLVRKARCAIRRATSKPPHVADVEWTKLPAKE